MNEVLGRMSGYQYIVDQFCHQSETIFSQRLPYIPRYIIISRILLIPHLLDRFFHFTLQNIRVFLVWIYFVFRFDFYIFWSISLVAELCNIILSNFQYFFDLLLHSLESRRCQYFESWFSVRCSFVAFTPWRYIFFYFVVWSHMLSRYSFVAMSNASVLFVPKFYAILSTFFDVYILPLPSSASFTDHFLCNPSFSWYPLYFSNQITHRI